MLEVSDGLLLEPVDVECGVLQGNPLSPLLFNIYIDGALEAVRRHGASRPKGPVGLPLPRVAGRGTRGYMPSAQAATVARGGSDCKSQDDWMEHLFFADDGTIPSLDLDAMQESVNVLVTELDVLGLTINVGKTKWLVVAPHFLRTKAQYSHLLQASNSARMPRVLGGN